MTSRSNQGMTVIHTVLFTLLISAQLPAQALVKVLEKATIHDTSYDGRYLVYSDEFSFVTPVQLYRLDRQTGQRLLISKNNAGVAGDRSSGSASMSADGRYIVFESSADNLIDNDQNPYIDENFDGRDIYLHDVQTGVTELISKSSQGIQGNQISGRPDISDDGQRIVYISWADNLVDNDQVFDTPAIIPSLLRSRPFIPAGIKNLIDAFLYDRKTSKTTLISRNSTGTQANGQTLSTVISGDGKTVVLSVSGDNMAPDKPNIFTQVYAKTLQTGAVELISRAPDGTFGNKGAGGLSHFGRNIAISKHGDYVAYDTLSRNIVPFPDGIYEYRRFVLFDRTQGTSVLASPQYQGLSIDGADHIDISDDGRYVAFTTTYSDQPSLTTPPDPWVYIYDRVDNTLAKAHRQGFEGEIFKSTFLVSISGNGHEILFNQRFHINQRLDRLYILSFQNPNIEGNNGLTLEKTINTDASDPALGEVIHLMANGRLYRTDYKVTNTSSDKRAYQIVIEDTVNGDQTHACTIPGLLPGQSKRCRAHYPVQKGFNSVPAQATAKVSGSKTMITAASPAAYQGHRIREGKLVIAQSLNKGTGDRQRDAILVNSGAAQQWLYKVENTTNVNLYKVKVYLDGQSPENTSWEQQCYLGRLKPGEIRYCQRERALGVPGLNLAQGWVQGVDAMPLHGKYEPVTNVNRTWYQMVP